MHVNKKNLELTNANNAKEKNIISILSDEDELVDFSNPCGNPHGQKICTNCINVLAQSAQLMGKQKRILSTKPSAFSKRTK